MPLTQGSSKAVVSANISEMERAGHPHAQSVVAALHTADENKHAEDPAAGTRGRMSGATIFSSGNHRGRPWTHGEISKIVDNFNRFSSGDNPGHVPPAYAVDNGPGHEDEYAEQADHRTDQPAGGWTKKVWREDAPCGHCRGEGCRDCFGTGKTAYLKANIDEIPADMQEALASGKFRYPSAEIYDTPEQAGLHGEGPMLRRVAYLGAEPPQVKFLGPLPPVERYSESRFSFRVLAVQRSSRGTWNAFSETSMHDPNAAMAPADPSAMAAQPDAGSIKMAEKPDEEWDQEPIPAMQPEEHKMHHDYACKMAEKWQGRAARYGEGMGGPSNEVTSQTARAMPMTPEMTPAKFAEMISAAVRKELQTAKGEYESFSEERRQADKKATVTAFCETAWQAGRLNSVEYRNLKAGGPDGTVFQRLMRANSRDKAVKFSEGGKEFVVSEFEAQTREIQSRPSTYGETFRKSDGSNGKPVPKMVNGKKVLPTDDAECEKIRDRFHKFSERYSKLEQTEDGMVEAFNFERMRNPELTADEYLA